MSKQAQVNYSITVLMNIMKYVFELSNDYDIELKN